MSLLLKKITAHSEGEPVLLIHGWAMNNHVFQPLVEAMPTVQFVGIDLPGHGDNAGVDLGDDLVEWTGQALHVLSEEGIGRCHILAWSLGGMLATLMAERLGEGCLSLSLLGSNPQFVQSDDWPNAMPPIYLQRFMQNLQQSKDQVIQEFMELQVRGAQHAKPALDKVLQLVKAGGTASDHGLQHGLSVLEKGNVREQLADVQCPVHFVLGQRDTLVPAAVADNLRALQKQAEFTVLPKSGHAPFISHTENCVTALQYFWSQVNGA